MTAVREPSDLPLAYRLGDWAAPRLAVADVAPTVPVSLASPSFTLPFIGPPPPIGSPSLAAPSLAAASLAPPSLAPPRLAMDDFPPTDLPGQGRTTPTLIERCPLRPHYDSVRTARDFTRRTLRGWSETAGNFQNQPVSALEALTDDLALIVSELVTNALRHGLSLDLTPLAGKSWSSGRTGLLAECDLDWPVELSLSYAPSWLVCAVNDPSDDIPIRRTPNPTTGSGRGLHLIESLSLAWGWAALVNNGKTVGKTVWALITLSQDE